MYNAYLHIATSASGNRIVLAEHVEYAEAEAACKAQLIYLPKCGRIGNMWLDARMLPRLVIVDAERERADLLSPNPITLDDLLARLSVNYEPV